MAQAATKTVIVQTRVLIIPGKTKFCQAGSEFKAHQHGISVSVYREITVYIPVNLCSRKHTTQTVHIHSEHLSSCPVNEFHPAIRRTHLSATPVVTPDPPGCQISHDPPGSEAPGFTSDM